MFAGVAAALCILERSYERTSVAVKPLTNVEAAVANGPAGFSPLRR